MIDTEDLKSYILGYDEDCKQVDVDDNDELVYADEVYDLWKVEGKILFEREKIYGCIYTS